MTTGARRRPQNRPAYMTLPGPNAAPDNYEPLPDAMFQAPHFTRTMEIVQTHFLHQESTVVSGDTPVYFRDCQDNQRFFRPDCYVAFDVDQVAIRERNGYFIDEVGKPPDFALEIASETTAENDIGFKRNLYAWLGIGEYWRFDPTGGRLYGAPLAGERLVDGAYQPFDIHETPDGVIWGHSPALGLDLCWVEERLQLYNLATGEYLRDLPEAEAQIIELQDEMTRTEERLNNERAAREEAQQAAQDERVAREEAQQAAQDERIAREEAQQAAQDEQAARQEVEAREQALLEQLRRLLEGRDPPEQPT